MTQRSALTPLLLATLFVSLSACAAAPINKPIEGGPVDTGSGSLTQARQYLEGRWSLESFEVHPPGRPVMMVPGQGTLTYDAFSNLQIEIRADQSAAGLLRTVGIDLQDGVISTTGRTAVDMPNRTLSYVITGKAPENTGPLGMSRLRYWQVEGDLLTLTTKDDAGNVATVGRWRKMR